MSAHVWTNGSAGFLAGTNSGHGDIVIPLGAGVVLTAGVGGGGIVDHDEPGSRPVGAGARAAADQLAAGHEPAPGTVFPPETAGAMMLGWKIL